MVTKFILRPHSLSFTVLSQTRVFPTPSFIKPVTVSVLSATTTAAAATSTLTTTYDEALPYGPSLHRGYRPTHQSQLPIDHKVQEQQYRREEEESDESLIGEKSFTRVFDIAALRVPSEHCFTLESRLRGHLLNWPRIRNIARVPADEVEDEFKYFLKHQSKSDFNDDNGRFASLNRRIYGKAEGDGEPLSRVLYRDKLAKTFNSRGFVKFRNLAKLSRPKKGKKKRQEEERDRSQKKGVGKNELAAVEVVEDKEVGEDLSGLLGHEFKGKKWTGSTRLLLLDERYVGKDLDELPEAIKVSVPTL